LSMNNHCSSQSLKTQVTHACSYRSFTASWIQLSSIGLTSSKVNFLNQLLSIVHIQIMFLVWS
jgi:hypothetical protein